jgi:cytochrome c553
MRWSTASIEEADMTSENEAEDRSWRVRSSIAVITIVVVAALLGFVVLPVVQGRSAGVDAFTAICRALGLEAGSPAVRQPLSATRAEPVSKVAWTGDVIARLHDPNEAKAADLAANNCASCHGADGVSPDPQFPHMAGQSAFAIYKQLHDFKNGARGNEIMASVVEALDDQQMADIAAYYAAFTKGALDPTTPATDDPAIVRLVERGITDRGLPACASCHGAHAGGPVETPTLAGQRHEYLVAQLRAFAKGERRNDIYHRMRDIAKKLTDTEIEELAAYYAGIGLYQRKQ